jgi:hypothetical protein
MSLRGAKITFTTLDETFEPVTKHLSTIKGNRKGETVHYANPVMYGVDELHQMVMWCIDTFGKPGQCDLNTLTKKWDYQQSPDYWFWFYDEKYLMMFMLRWSP